MGLKRAHLDSNFQPEKRSVKVGDDRISRLPDDILVVILNSIPLKEASRTSVLSTRWKNLWKYSTCLTFEDVSALDKMVELYKQVEIRDAERCKYVNWVNSVLGDHKGLSVEEFRIRFDFDGSSEETITKWLEFAFARKVERLELNLLEYGQVTRFGDKSFLFPQVFCIPHKLFDFKSLKSLSLISVEVAEEVVEIFLGNCPLLEQLTIEDCFGISNLKVCSLSLKRLEIYHCYRLKCVEVSAPNLTSLKITAMSAVLLEKAPILVELFADCWSKEGLAPLLDCISQLEVLTLNFFNMALQVIPISISISIIELPKLKKLVLEVSVVDDESLMPLTCLVKACPYLEEVVIKLYWVKVSWRKREIDKAVGCPHQHLKVVKFEGYGGRPNDVELVEYLVENCVVLQKLVIDTRMSTLFRRGPIDSRWQQNARKYAKEQIHALQLPHYIQLVFL